MIAQNSYCMRQSQALCAYAYTHTRGKGMGPPRHRMRKSSTFPERWTGNKMEKLWTWLCGNQLAAEGRDRERERERDPGAESKMLHFLLWHFFLSAATIQMKHMEIQHFTPWFNFEKHLHSCCAQGEGVMRYCHLPGLLPHQR